MRPDEKVLTDEDGHIHCRSYCGADRRTNQRASVLPEVAEEDYK
jgi:hypothetical protein